MGCTNIDADCKHTQYCMYMCKYITIAIGHTNTTMQHLPTYVCTFRYDLYSHFHTLSKANKRQQQSKVKRKSSVNQVCLLTKRLSQIHTNVTFIQSDQSTNRNHT